MQSFRLLEPFQAARHEPILDTYRPFIAKNAMNGAQPFVFTVMLRGRTGPLPERVKSNRGSFGCASG